MMNFAFWLWWGSLGEEAARIEGWVGLGVGLDAGNQIPVSRALG